MDYQDLKKKVKSMGERVTKDVRGKRVRLTINELRKKVKRDMKNRVNNARETIAMCKSIVSVGGRPAPPHLHLQASLRSRLSTTSELNLCPN
jgi:hypothetical protein